MYARIALSAWATRLVGRRAHTEIRKLGVDEKDDKSFRVHIPASANDRTRHLRVLVQRHEMMEFTMDALITRLKRRAPLIWFLTEEMAGPKKKGVIVIRKTRPHPMIQAAAICSFLISRNRFATGYMAMQMGIWHFACKSHIDIKRVYTRLGSSVSDHTARLALIALADSGRKEVRDTIARVMEESGYIPYCRIFDNVQQYQRVYEHGSGRRNKMITGTAATAVLMSNVEPGAFDVQDHLDRVMANERRHLTVSSLYDDIDWQHLDEALALHFVRTLVEFIPQLNHLQSDVSKSFRTTLAKHRMPDDHVTIVQPLGTNAEKEIENAGMYQSQLDFDAQMGIKPEYADKSLQWERGDGGSFGTFCRVKKIMTVQDIDRYLSFRNRISTPEIWHSRATNLNTTASNHYGPPACGDPSSLTQNAAATSMYRPPDLSKCDFYPTSRTMSLIWNARVLDVWSIQLANHGDILEYFESQSQADIDAITVESLMVQARSMVKCYANSTAHQQALSKEDSTSGDDEYRIPAGDPWTDHTFAREGFDGDQVLANSILYLRDFGWWTEISYAVADGDIGRVYEILKAWIFVFAGASNRNYTQYFLEMYCLFQYEASTELHDALFNNWLIALAGKLRARIEGDLLQEHSNKWLEDFVQAHGGDFDKAFYRDSISPNVLFFLRFKEVFEDSFDLKRRSKSHTSLHLRVEYQILFKIFRKEQIQLFRSTRFMGHVAFDFLNRGWPNLGERIPDFVKRTSAHAAMVRKIEEARTIHLAKRDTQPNTPPFSSTTPFASLSPPSDIASALHDSMSYDQLPSPFLPPTIPGISTLDLEEGSGSEGSVSNYEDRDDEEEMDKSEDEFTVLESGSDLAPVLDPETGRMLDDWHSQEEFEGMLREAEREEAEKEDDEEAEDNDEFMYDSDGEEA
ncbi:hypothetical protein BDZ89DRAFT_1012477 [Hymenopellis radicata]|nr:hypothetical protein BDZ89DRAFT_1012477 [Hymenopellis radicata]